MTFLQVILVSILVPIITIDTLIIVAVILTALYNRSKLSVVTLINIPDDASIRMENKHND